MRKPDILEFLRRRGCTLIQDGNRYVTNSPIKALSGINDKTPSFTIFSDGGWKDFSTGEHGDIYRLQRLLGDSTDLSSLGEYMPPTVSTKQGHWGGSIPPKYLEVTQEEREEIIAYGASRHILRGFTPAVYFTPDYERRPALMFVHIDINGEISGAKFRSIHNHEGKRFVMRGRPGFYTLTTNGIFIKPRLFLIESETSANSLWEHCMERQWTAIVLSTGGVENIPDKLPNYGTKQGTLIVDFDGNEELYQSRVRKYSHLGLKPLKLELPKGEDINSLYCKNKLWI
jgi:hypothetical protein